MAPAFDTATDGACRSPAKPRPGKADVHRRIAETGATLAAEA